MRRRLLLLGQAWRRLALPHHTGLGGRCAWPRPESQARVEPAPAQHLCIQPCGMPRIGATRSILAKQKIIRAFSLCAIGRDPQAAIEGAKDHVRIDSDAVWSRQYRGNLFMICGETYEIRRFGVRPGQRRDRAGLVLREAFSQREQFLRGVSEKYRRRSARCGRRSHSRRASSTGAPTQKPSTCPLERLCIM